MQPGDTEAGMNLSKAEGWNQTGRDWKRLIENPGNVCMLAEGDDKVIGTTTAINYSNQLAWIGMVLVDKAYRGQGVSKSLLTDIFEKVAAFKSVKLDATPDGQQVYKKFGFKDEYLIARMTNTSFRNLFPEDDNDILPESIQFRHIPEIIALDKLVFGVNRTQLFESLIKEYPGRSWLIKRNNRITGFALGREGNRYNQIGPVIASGSSDAKLLIMKALKGLENQAVVVDALCDKEDLVNWLNSIGFIKQRQFIRMYKEVNPFPGVADNQYLICGPEFG
ncbi:MAG: GNAT family N-acetyltransferase [Ferruginibacter sp.]